MVIISHKAENELLQAGTEIHQMALEAVDLVVKNDELLDMFYINRDLWPAIKQSWDKKQLDFQGRFDFAWDGINSPKLLEYNADTPSLQIESSILQKKWMNDYQKQQGLSNFHQSNYLEDNIKKFAKKLFDQCGNQNIYSLQNVIPKTLAIITNFIDDENTSVMLFLKNILD